MAFEMTRPTSSSPLSSSSPSEMKEKLLSVNDSSEDESPNGNNGTTRTPSWKERFSLSSHSRSPSPSTPSTPSSTSSSSLPSKSKRGVSAPVARHLIRDDLLTSSTIRTLESQLKAPPVSSGSSVSLRRLLFVAKPERSLLVGATVCLFVSAGLSMMIPAIVGGIIDAISRSDDSSEDPTPVYTMIVSLGFGDTPRAVLNVSCVVLMALSALSGAFSGLRGYMFNMAGERVVARLRQNLFASLMAMEVTFFDVTRTGELLNRLSTDTTVLRDAVTVNISMGLRWAATIVIGIIYLFLVSWKLTLVMLGCVPVVAIGVRTYGKKIRAVSKQTQEALAKATETAEESISHIRTVKSFSKEDYQQMLFKQKIDVTYSMGVRMSVLYGWFMGLITFIGTAVVVVILWVGAQLVFEGALTPGILTSYVLYTLTIAFAFAGLSGLFASFMQALGATERVFELLDRKPTINCRGGLRPNRFNGHLQLKDVWFRYPARPEVQVLKGITLDLKPGTVTALVGASGSGKSSIAALIERFYDLNDPFKFDHIVATTEATTGGRGSGRWGKWGKSEKEAKGASVPSSPPVPLAPITTLCDGLILLDGNDIRSLDPAWVHRHVGFVSQEPILFASTIRDNILYGLPDDLRSTVTQTHIDSACEKANALSFIRSFPDGFETVVGERGIRLSGGQKQRCCLARAFLLDPLVLIADEATSALDAESEHHVQVALERLMRGKTVLLIAHRLSTIKDADNICVMHEGKIAESGTHNELMSKKGYYAQLVSRQITGPDETVATDLEEEERKEV